MQKDFDQWNVRKQRLNASARFNHPRAGEIWWCSIGVNIGTESCGKGGDFSRPVLIVNTEGAESFIGIPLTSKLKNSKYSCIITTPDKKKHTLLIYQIRNMDKRRLIRKLYTLNAAQAKRVETKLYKLYKI